MIQAGLLRPFAPRTWTAAGDAALDAMFDRAPVGLAFFDRHLRCMRVNDRLAQINGVALGEHVGRAISEVLPGLVPDVAPRVAALAKTGTPAIDVQLTGETAAQPGVAREWIASFWPVHPGAGEEPIGIGCMVLEVTDRRAAERALRTQTDRYETLLLALSEVGEGMVVLEDGRCVYANAAFERLSGYAFEELAAMDSLFDLVVEEDRDEARLRAVRRAEEGLVDLSYQLAVRRRDGAVVELELAGVPLRVEGRDQLVVVVRDFTARRHAEEERERLLRRSALLAEASELFDQSLDEERTMRSVARLSVRDVADTCVVLLGDAPGRFRRVAAVARDPEREALLAELQERFPLEQRPDHPMFAVLRSGHAAVLADLPQAQLEELAQDARHLELMHAIGVHTTIVVPLRARGGVHGLLAAGFDALDASEPPEVVALLEDLGRRAALALDNARLYEERSAVARTLQRSLLPPELPAIPGLQVAARYLAAGEGNEVGGDFYDCFYTGGGDWAVVIGDVCGKGAEAAAITALARHTLRASVLHSRRPQTVLRVLNEALLRHALDYRFCTVLYASLTPRDGRVTACLATGGHPLPLVLRATGQVETAGRPGTLLGIVEQPAISEQRIELEPGDALVLYTDGVIEAGPVDGGSGAKRLEAFLAGCSGRDAGRIAESIEHEVLTIQDGPLRDDVAVVVARVEVAGQAPFAPVEEGVAARS